ncbi:MAG: alpha/beta hydrolase fold domain-containing protein [Mangrovibacterium sp.]
MKKLFILSVLFSLVFSFTTVGNKVKRISDVIYDHRDGAALVFDVLIPEKQNGIAVFKMVSGGWTSYNAAAHPDKEFKEFTDRGETVFLVSHGSRPRFKVPEIIDQVQRAIQYVRYHAKAFGVNPNRFGITGGSSGGHLAVSAAVFGKDEVPEAEYRQAHSLKNTDIVDPVNLVSSKVQAVACFFPPVNLVNYNHPDSTFADFKNVAIFVDAFDINKDTPRDRVKGIFRESSPYFFISPSTPPILIFQGTKDLLVPYSQATSFIEKLKENHVPCQLITNEGAAHGWTYNKADDLTMIRWFETYLLKR